MLVVVMAALTISGCRQVSPPPTSAVPPTSDQTPATYSSSLSPLSPIATLPPIAITADELIVFVSLREGNPALYAIQPDGSNLIPLVRTSGSRRIEGQLDWSKAARSLAFAMTADGRSDVFALNFAGLPSLRSVTSAEQSSSVDPRWSPTGEQLAYLCSDREPDICIIQADGSNNINLTSYPSRDVNVSWSPDGSAVVYQSDRGGLSDIYVIALEDLSVTDLTGGGSQNAAPSWSPTDDRIVFQSDRQGAMDIFTIAADGSQLTNLSKSGSLDLDPKWSPDGDLIAFRSNREGKWDLFVVSEDGSDLQNLTQQKGPVYTFCWSPDGESLAYTSDREGNNEIYIISVGDGTITNVTQHPAQDTNPLWVNVTD